MKRLTATLILSLGFFAPAFSIIPESQWFYTSTTLPATAMAYSTASGDGYSSGAIANPASPASIQRFRIYETTGFSTRNFFLNAGISLPLPNGVLSTGGRILMNTNTFGTLGHFYLGFAKDIQPDFSFGFNVYLYNLTYSNSSDIAAGIDLGSVIRFDSLLPFETGFGFRNNTASFTLRGLGKPILIDGWTNGVPGSGISAGLSGECLQIGAVRASASLDICFQPLPMNLFGGVGLDFKIAKYFHLYNGIIAGNNGIGSLDHGMLFFTAGAGIAYHMWDMPFELNYSINPTADYTNIEWVHHVGIEVAFGSADRRSPKIILTSSKTTDGYIYISPNYDGSQDSASWKLDIQDESLIREWKMVILSENGTVVKRFESREARDISLDPVAFWKKLWANREAAVVPDRIEWDGMSSSGQISPEGTYHAYLIAVDAAGNTGVSATNTIVIDITAPLAKLAAYDNIFSPNGDGKKDTLELIQELSPQDHWKAEIRDVNNSISHTWDWPTNAPSTIAWDGKDQKGEMLPDGSYDYLLYGEDLAGNRTIVPVRDLLLNTQLSTAFLKLDKSAISPNADGYDDTLLITPVVPITNGLTSCILKVKQKNGAMVRSYRAKTLPTQWTFDGKREDYFPVADGNYLVCLEATYENGDNPKSQDYPFLVDTQPPQILFSFSPSPFSPDNDGESDVMAFRLKLEDPSAIRKWKLVILDPDQKPFKTFEGRGYPSEKFRWDGRSDNGELVESAADYPVELYTSDNLGNALEGTNLGSIPIDVLVERIDRGLRIRLNNVEFEFGKADLLTTRLPILNRVNQLLGKYANYRVEIQGHTDNVGSQEKNLILSKDRAESVFRYLVSQGMNPARITTEGFGFQYPIADNGTTEGRRKNRRVDFILVKNS